MRWVERIDARPAVQRGCMVNRTFCDDLSMQLHERHDASDFELRTQDKVQNAEEIEKVGYCAGHAERNWDAAFRTLIR